MNKSEARSEMFLVQQAKTSISYLEEIFRVDAYSLIDDAIKNRKDYMSKHLQ